VVQELYLARKAEVICGRLTISWQDLEQACEALLWKVDKLKSSDGGLKLMLDSIEGWRPLAHTMVRGLPSRSLLALLYSFRNSKCTNARDRVYALLGICIDGQGIKVDYNSLIHDVYINWTWRQIETTKTLEVFSACNDSKAAGLPSWTPDLENGLGADRNEPYGFTSTILVDASTLYDSYGKLPYCASGRSVCNPTLSADRRILSLSGMHIDSLKAIFDPETALELLKTDRQFANLESLKDDNGIPSIIRAKIHYLESEVAKHFHLSELSYGSDDWIGFTDVLFRGLKNWHPFGDGNPEEIGNRYSTWRGFAPIDPHFEPEMKHKMRRAAYLEQVSWILMLILNSCTLRFYVTARGQIGVVHPALNAQVGDKVFVLFGGNTPFILRNEGEKHRLMGPCYQHGLMDGEAIAGWRISKYKTERITLV
jgi:hypothetical protein